MALEDDEEYQNLKPNHQAFVYNILTGKNATDSYALAFPKANRKTAGVKGSVLKEKFSDMLHRHAPINLDKIDKVANQTLHNLTLMAFADIGDIVDSDGRPKALHKMPKPLRMAITEVEVEGEKIKYKIGGKTKAMEILAKIAKLHNDVPEINVSIITEEERESRLKEIVVKAMSRKDGGEE
jgi:hypothetical protein